MRHLAYTISQSGSRSELKRNKKRISGAKSGYPSRILACWAEFRSSDIGNVIPSLSRARFIIKFMASSGNRTLYVPDRQTGASTFLSRARYAVREKLFPLLSYGSHSRTPDRSCRESGNSLFRSRGDSARARYKRIFYDSCSCHQYRRGFSVCLYNMAKRSPRQEVAPKELDGNDILTSARSKERYKINVYF